MNADQGRQFLKALGVEVESTGSGWLRGKCPLSTWTHQKGADSSPSFGISIDKSKHSVYHCFACSSGGLPELLQQLEMLSAYGTKGPIKFHFGKAREILENEKLTVVPLGEYSEFGAEQSKIFEPWKDDALNTFPWASQNKNSVEYLKYRGLTVEDADKFKLRMDPNRWMLVSPYWDVYGRLAGARGRLMDFGEDHNNLKHYDYTIGGQNNAHFCWYNEQCLNLPGPALVVEGQFDVQRVTQVWPKTVGNMTSKPSQRKLEKLAYTDSAILFLDNDLPGQEATGEFQERLTKLSMKIGVLGWDGALKGDFHLQRDPHKSKTPKDPDEVSLEWLRNQLIPH